MDENKKITLIALVILVAFVVFFAVAFKNKPAKEIESLDKTEQEENKKLPTGKG